jgi:hypothetical protein
MIGQDTEFHHFHDAEFAGAPNVGIVEFAKRADWGCKAQHDCQEIVDSHKTARALNDLD